MRLWNDLQEVLLLRRALSIEILSTGAKIRTRTHLKRLAITEWLSMTLDVIAAADIRYKSANAVRRVPFVTLLLIPWVYGPFLLSIYAFFFSVSFLHYATAYTVDGYPSPLHGRRYKAMLRSVCLYFPFAGWLHGMPTYNCHRRGHISSPRDTMFFLVFSCFIRWIKLAVTSFVSFHMKWTAADRA